MGPALSSIVCAGDPRWEAGKGICKQDGVTINRGQPLVACADHLNPPCADVLDVSGACALARATVSQAEPEQLLQICSGLRLPMRHGYVSLRARGQRPPSGQRPQRLLPGVLRRMRGEPTLRG